MEEFDSQVEVKHLTAFDQIPSELCRRPQPAEWSPYTWRPTATYICVAPQMRRFSARCRPYEATAISFDEEEVTWPQFATPIKANLLQMIQVCPPHMQRTVAM